MNELHWRVIGENAKRGNKARFIASQGDASATVDILVLVTSWRYKADKDSV